MFTKKACCTYKVVLFLLIYTYCFFAVLVAVSVVVAKASQQAARPRPQLSFLLEKVIFFYPVYTNPMRTLTRKVTFHKRSPEGNSVSFHKNKMIHSQSRKITVINVMTIVFWKRQKKNSFSIKKDTFGLCSRYNDGVSS